MHAQESSQFRRIAAFYRNRDGFMGMAVVAKDNRILFAKNYGYANIEWHIPFAEDTRFPIGSLSKQFTAAAILLLQREGKLKTSDPVSLFYKEAPAAWAHITLRNLLTQTSGIPDFDFSESVRNGPRPPRKEVETVAALPLKSEPGTAFDYSNANYVLLGMVIESVSGEPYCRFLQERIFEPLGLTQTGCDWRSDLIPHRASGYRPYGKSFLPAEEDDLTGTTGAGSLYSTTGDLIRWTSALHSGRVLNQASLKEMTSPFLNGYAYGLEIDGASRIGHNGVIDGFYVGLDYLPETRTTVLVLSNVNTDGNQRSPGAFAMETELIESVLDPHSILPSEGRELPLPDAILSRYTGRYKATDSHESSSLQVTLNGNHLLLQLDGSGNRPAELRAESQSDFYIAGREAEVDFNPDGSVLMIDYDEHAATSFVRISESQPEPAPRSH
jgi:CubicO group peptidase (beta-lactamase class C family)